MKALIIILAVIIVIIIAGLGIIYLVEKDNIALESQSNNNGIGQYLAPLNSTSSKNIVEEVGDNKNLRIFLVALKEAGMEDILFNGGPYTLFAPTDKAFNQLSTSTMLRIVNQKEFLIDVLKNHIVDGAYLSSDFKVAQNLKNLNQKDLLISLQDGLKVGDSKIVQQDIVANNGIIYTIDKVILTE